MPKQQRGDKLGIDDLTGGSSIMINASAEMGLHANDAQRTGRKSMLHASNKNAAKLKSQNSLAKVNLPTAPTVPQKSIPSFFETEDVQKAVAAKNPKYVFVSSAPKEVAVLTVPIGGKTTAIPEPTVPAMKPHAKPIKEAAEPVPKPQSAESLKKPKDAAEIKNNWAEIRERFRSAFEDNQGRQLCFAIRQMEDDCQHIERTLVRTHKKKIMLIYHLKYLSRAVRKNCVQTKHAAKLEESVENIIKETAATQDDISRKTGIINLGVRSQLQQMQNILWEKLGMQQYKPSPKAHLNMPTSKAADQKAALLHMNNMPDIPRDDQVEMLLDSANFKRIADKPNGLLAAEQFIINYLKHCGEVYQWMQNLKVSYPTKHGSKRSCAVKDLPLYEVDTAGLFAGLSPTVNPVETIKENFPGGDVRVDVQPNIDTVAAMFQIPPFAPKASNEPNPPQLINQIHFNLSDKLSRKANQAELQTFDQFAADHTDIFQFVDPPHVAPNRKSTVPMEDPLRPVGPNFAVSVSGLRLFESRHNKNEFPSLAELSSKNTVVEDNEHGKAGAHGKTLNPHDVVKS